MPNGTKKTSDFSFKGNSTLEIVILPTTVERIGKESFYGCKALREVSMYDTVKRIDEDAFEACPSLRKIYIPIGCLEKFKKLLDEKYWNKLEEIE